MWVEVVMEAKSIRPTMGCLKIAICPDFAKASTPEVVGQVKSEGMMRSDKHHQGVRLVFRLRHFLSKSWAFNNIKDTQDWPKRASKQVLYKFKKSARVMERRDRQSWEWSTALSSSSALRRQLSGLVTRFWLFGRISVFKFGF